MSASGADRYRHVMDSVSGRSEQFMNIGVTLCNDLQLFEAQVMIKSCPRNQIKSG